MFAAMVISAVFLLFNPLPFGEGLGLIMSLLTMLWLVSLWVKDASIIDIFWGPGFVILAWFYFWNSPGPGSFRNVLLCLMVSLWGLRLGLHIGLRNIGKGEDFRYRQWRKDGGKNYWWISFFRVFVLQGILMWVISSPLMFAMSDSRVFYITGWDELGIFLWLAGFLFETIGDWQLRRFKKDPANKGKVMDKGLWAWTRHPNYFGDALLWWGYFMFALDVPGGFWFVFSPLLMTFLLMRVSGVSMLESSLKNTKPGYEDYIRRTSAFFPLPPGQGS